MELAPRSPARKCRSDRGVILMEVTIALGFAVFLSLLLMKSSLLAISSNQWTIMQTLSDAYLTKETALSNRIPLGDLTTSPSQWPDQAKDNPPYFVETVTLGVLPSGRTVQGQLTRFRTNETPTSGTDVSLTVWRLHSVLTFTADDHQYVKTRSTLRTQ